MTTFVAHVRSRCCRAGLCVALACCWAGPTCAQTAPPPSAREMRQLQSDLNGRSCPGDPPGNLESFDCSFTSRMRLLEFVSTSVTDQALGGAAFFGGVGYWWHRDPPEWGRGWNSLGRGVGSRYTQNLAKGTATYAFSWAMQTDPRHVSLNNDPGFERNTPARTPGRIGHALLDWVTVRRSNVNGNGRRWPNLPLWAGAAASGLVSNAWLPSGSATPQSAIVTASSSLATALAASVYSEFSPELGRALGGMFKRGRTSTPNTAGKGSAQ